MTWALFSRLAFLLLVVAVVFTYHNATNAQEQNATARQALCAFKADLQRRYDNGRQYLKDLDSGKREPIPGVSRTDITTSLDNQRSTLIALRELVC